MPRAMAPALLFAAALSLPLPAAPLLAAGRLAYLTCDFPACESVVLSSLDLASGASTPLWSLPTGSLDDAYTGNVLLADASTLLLGLQYDAAPAQGALVTFDLAARAPRATLNVSSCVVLLLDPADAAGTRLLCLAIVQGGPAGETTQLRHIDRASGADTLVATLFPGHATFGEAVLSRGVLFVPMAPLDGGPFFIAAVDPQSGRVLATNATFPFTLTMVGLVADAPAPGDGSALSVVRTEDGNGGDVRGFLARVDLATAAVTQIGAGLNMTRWTQLNPINALDAAAGVLYLTAFEGGAGNALHLLGLDTRSGLVVSDRVVANPFADICFIGA